MSSSHVETGAAVGGQENESGLLTSRSDLRFPHPSERPDTIVVIFDGRCKFCTQQVRLLQRLDRRQRLSFVSLHDPCVARWWPHLTYERLMQEIYVLPPAPREGAAATPAGPSTASGGEAEAVGVESDGVLAKMAGRQRAYPGAEGARYLLWQLVWLWPVAAVMSVPGSMPLWRALYRWVARQRYRFGKLGPECDPDGTCDLHFGPKKLGEK
jgi:predicted DCC family thiol-disulfide oxidoreductase YuxK